MSEFNFRQKLAEEVWEEGKLISLVVGSYRHEVVALCSSLGRREAEFANGKFRYFAWVELLGAGDKRIEQGAGIVPVLPDGRLLMVVEQRPPQGKVASRPYMVERLSGKPIDLRAMGEYSSLEFPGGAVDPEDKSLRAGFLRELQQETGVQEQTATLYRSLHPVWSFGADISVEGYYGVAFLTGMKYEEKVEDDGGMYILALTRGEVWRNIVRGVIVSGQAALLQWNFFRDIEMVLRNKEFMDDFLRLGYFVKEEVRLVKP